MDTQGTPVKNIWSRLGAFVKELWHDQDLWIRAIATKGGAGIVLATGLVGIAHVVALPFFVAAVGLTICGGLIGVGLFGMAYGAKTVWDTTRDIYSRTVLGKPPEKKAEASGAPHELPFIKKILQKPLIKKITNSRAWRTTRVLTQKQQGFLLAGFAGTGSLLWGAMSAVTLVTQILLLPVIAVGGLLTIGTAVAFGGLLSSVYGSYLAVKSLAKTLRAKKKTKAVKTSDKTRIAGYFFSSAKGISGLLPSDRWILATAFDILKTDQDLKRSLRRIAGFSLLAGISAATGVAAVMVTSGIGVAIAAGAAGIAVTRFAGKAAGSWKHLKSDIVPKLRTDVVTRYLTVKAEEMAKRLKESKPKEGLEKPPVKDAPDSGVKKMLPDPGVKKTTDTSLAATFGSWALRKAMQKPRSPNHTPPDLGAQKPPPHPNTQGS